MSLIKFILVWGLDAFFYLYWVRFRNFQTIEKNFQSQHIFSLRYSHILSHSLDNFSLRYYFARLSFFTILFARFIFFTILSFFTFFVISFTWFIFLYDIILCFTILFAQFIFLYDIISHFITISFAWFNFLYNILSSFFVTLFILLCSPWSIN